MPALKQPKVKSLDDRLLTLRNRVLSAHSWKQITTFGDLLHHMGYPHTYPYAEEQIKLPVDRKFCADFLDSNAARMKLEEHAATLPAPTERYYENNGHSTAVVVAQETTVVPPDEVIDAQRVDDAELGDPDYHPATRLQKAGLFPFQSRAAVRLFHRATKKNQRGQLLLAPVGTGKTYILGSFIRNIIDTQFLLGKTVSPWPIFYVTKASIVEQTSRVLEKEFGINVTHEVHVTNIDQLRATFGALFLKETTVVEDGMPRIKWVWKPNLHPAIIIWDECQILKNTDSIQSQIAQSFNDIPNPHTWQIFSSATPFTRVCETKCFCVATRIPYTYGVAVDAPMVNSHFTDFAKWCAAPANPEEHSPAAIERFMKFILDYVVDVKNVRPKHKAQNSIQMIRFQTREEKELYDKGWEDYLAEKAKIEGDDAVSEAQAKFLILVQFLKFRMRAELIRAPRIAEFMDLSVKNGKAAVAALCFKQTIVAVVKCLHERYGVSREDISLIWGGIMPPKPGKKKLSEEAIAILEAAGVDLADIGYDVDEEADEGKKVLENLPEHLNLGPQNAKKRQIEIDKFQNGRSRYCLFSFKSGGVGLSLHHNNDKTLPREVILTPTYSAIELVQGLGRCPRLTSLSDTPQVVVFYAGTIEERVAQRVGQKLKCLRKVVRQRESWEDCIVGEQYTKHRKALKELADGEDEVSLDSSAAEDDEEQDS